MGKPKKGMKKNESNSHTVELDKRTASLIFSQALEKVKAYKEAHGIKDSQLADALGIRPQAIKKMLVSAKPVTLDKITQALISVTGIDFDPFRCQPTLNERTFNETFSPIPPTRELED